MSQWRSSPMSRVAIATHESSARSTLIALSDRIHLIDLNADDPCASEFVLVWKRRALLCATLLQRVEQIGSMMEAYGVVPNDVTIDVKLELSLDGIQAALGNAEKELAHHTDVMIQLDADVERMCEKLLVLTLCQSLTKAGIYPADSEMELVQLQDDDQVPLREAFDDSVKSKRLRRVCGCIRLADRATLERMIYRISRGNAHCTFELDNRLQIDDVTRSLPARLQRTPKPQRIAFCVFVVGRQMEIKVRHLVSLLGTLHQYDENSDFSEIQSIIDEIRDTIGVMQATAVHLNSLLKTLAVAQYRSWFVALRRELALSIAMQNCRPIHYMGSQTLQIEGWVYDVDGIRSALSQTSLRSGGSGAIIHELSHGSFGAPTRFPPNALLGTFQKMVDTYGTPRYREINPAVLTVITFPFMFGQMFGDVGHGIILLVVALSVFLFRLRLPSSLMPLYRYRYLILLMSLFSIYCGAIYNDLFGWSLSLWPTCWVEFEGNLVQAGVYPFGIDPSWHGSDNELSFLNSVKMKLAIVFGVIHMMAGIILSAFNHREFNDQYAMRYEFIPQLLFLGATFGYMALLIVIKTCYDWRDTPPPSIIQTMIGLFVGGEYIPMFVGQWVLHGFLRLVALCCVPAMLLGGPWARWRERRSSFTQYKPVQPHLTESDLDPSSEGIALALLTEEKSPHGLPESSRSENMIEDLLHHAIHTIEFVLGAVSNTASYLRLWALSLAHQQLALVFLERILLPGLNSSSVITIVIAAFIWTVATLGVLCGMDAFECLLHALRLHWVEFQSKFFRADGVAWCPFSLTELDPEVL